MKNKQYYINAFDTFYDVCVKQARQEIIENDWTLVDAEELAWEIFEDTATSDPIIGYYIAYHKELALSTWQENTALIEMSEQDREIDKILKLLYS